MAIYRQFKVFPFKYQMAQILEICVEYLEIRELNAIFALRINILKIIKVQ